MQVDGPDVVWGAVDRPALGRPVLVLGADSPTGLGVARALRSEGTRVVGLAVDTAAPSCRSLAWSQVLPVADESVQGWLSGMSGAAAHGRMVLIPVRDDTVTMVARHREVLDRSFDIVLPGPDVVETLMDKTVFHEWAVKQGLPVPRTEVVTDAASLSVALARVTYPVLLKPYERTVAWQKVNQRRKAFRLECAADIDTIPFDLFDLSPRYVLQQWIDGLDSDVYFCMVYRDRHGQELGYQVGRKLLQWPVEAGNTVVCVSAEDEELHGLTTKVLDAAGAVGLASLEVKRHRGDGRYYITEPTVGRPNLQSGVATAAGLNLTALAYRDACGLPHLVPNRTGARSLWVHESTLLPALVTTLRRGRMDVRAVLGAMRNCPVRVGAFAARGDRGPLWSELGRQARRARRTIRGRFR